MARKRRHDRAESVAYDTRAPKAEQRDAMAELTQRAIPTTMLDQDQLDHIFAIAADDMRKADNVVPFPSANAKQKKRGMRSVEVDEFGIANQVGEYWERNSVMSFDALRQMVDQTPLLNAIIMTRVRQVMRFAGVQEDADGLGFTIKHVDREHQITKQEQESIKLLNRFFANCGWEFNPRKRRQLKRDSFSQFLAKLTRDSLTFDSAPIETEFKQDRSQGMDGFYAVDGSTIRLCTEQGYEGDDEIYALQVVQGRIRTTYNYDQLIYEPRNPRSDVLWAGYGMGETELLIKVVTGFLNGMTYNLKGFDANSIPKGMLHLSGNYGPSDLSAFKRQWNAMVRGVNNAWALPVMVSKDQESKASFESFGIQHDEMYFSKWMTFLASIACAIYGMSPSEINFDSFTGGNTSALSGSDTAEKLAESKDKGLRPLLAYFENLFSDYITQDFSDKYVFRFTGLDPRDRQEQNERDKLVLTWNEMRAMEGYEPIKDDIGDCPLNPSLIGVWQQERQANQPQDFGQMPPDGNGNQPPDEQPTDQQDEQPNEQPAEDAPDEANQKPDFGKQDESDFGKSLIYQLDW